MQVLRTLKSRRRIRGQISVLIIFTLIPLFTLLAFAINVGMMVSAKISLQNAADFAAYAGAATQARQMTHISHLNYQMRQAYKKFLYKYYVLGNLSLKCFPRDGQTPPGCPAAAGGAMKWENPGCSNPPCVPGVPSVCISLSTESNVCQIAEAVPLVKPPSCIPLDPTCQALANASATISAIQQKSCTATSAINQEVLTHWLYATDFNVEMQTNPNLQGLINDIGLVTEEILLKNRVTTVLDYINQPARSNVTSSAVLALEEVPDQAKVERTLMAFKTAAGNLNTKVFDPDSIQLTEFIPSNDPPMLELAPIDVDFDSAFTFFVPKGGDESKCDVNVDFMHAKPTVGFFKRPTSYVYYAVKVKAKAQLLFNPFPFGGSADENIELTAYAAAAPFGSRIGPALDASQFTKKGTPGPNPGGKSEINYPFLPIKPGLNWDDISILSAYHKALKGAQGATAPGGAVGRDDLERGLRAAQMPDEFEVGKYNIPVDVPSDNHRPENEGKSFSISYYLDDVVDDYTFWAPIVKAGENDTFTQQMQAELDQIINTVGNQQTGSSQTDTNKEALKAVLVGKLQGFLRGLSSRNAFNVNRMPDPLGTKFFVGNGPRPAIPGKNTNTDALASSYTTDKDDFYREHGRDGYSVKLIPFKHLFGATAKLTNIGSSVTIPQITQTFQGENSELLKIPH